MDRLNLFIFKFFLNLFKALRFVIQGPRRPCPRCGRLRFRGENWSCRKCGWYTMEY